MKILVLGGTKFFGVYAVRRLLANGHQITIATRGQTKDSFGNKVERIVLDRTEQQSMSDALRDKTFDIVCDNLVFCSNDVRYLLDVVSPTRYVYTSTIATYDENLQMDMPEEHFNPLVHPFHWCSRNEFPYGESKRQAECAVFQVYKDIPSAALRLPYVIGEDDYTKRLYFYVDHVVNKKPMYIDNIDEKLSFIYADEAGEFLAWAVENDFIGPLNGANHGSISIREMITYVEEKTGTQVILQPDGDPGAYNERWAFSTSTKKAEILGFRFSNLFDRLYPLLDKYIEIAKRKGEMFDQ